MVNHEIDYIIGDNLKGLGKKIKSKLIDQHHHTAIPTQSNEIFTYRELTYKGRRIICTYSSKRARKDAYERQKLIDKASKWLEEPTQYNQVKKRGAGRYITTTGQGEPIELDNAKITNDAVYDGYKALSTTTDLPLKDILSKYSDLFEVEHTFRALKSQLEIRPMFHWTDKRIKGHICLCFIAFTFINHLRNLTQLQYRDIVRALDKMQLSEIADKQANNQVYLRAKIDDDQQLLIDKLRLKVLNDITPQDAVNQYFTK